MGTQKKCYGRISYPERWSEVVERNYKAFLSTFIVREGEVRKRQDKSIDAARLSYVLAYRLNFEGIEDIETRQHLLNRAATAFIKAGGKERASRFSDFAVSLNAQLEQFLQQPLERFHVVLPFCVSANDLEGRTSFTVTGIRLTVSNWERVKKRFDLSRWLDPPFSFYPDVEGELLTNFVPLVCSASAYTGNEATVYAFEAFRLLRGVIALIKNYGFRQLRFVRTNSPMTDLRSPPTWAVFKSNGQFEGSGWGTDVPKFTHGPPSPAMLSPEDMKDVLYWLRRLKRPKAEDETMALLITAIKKYGRAHEISDYRQAFLELWQILELLTFPSDVRFNMSDVTKRVKIFLGSDASLVDLLEISSDVRNSLVHRGEFTDAEFMALDALKGLADYCIVSIIELKDRYPTWKELDAYYQMAGLPEDSLREKAKIINFLRHDKARQKVQTKH